MVGVGTESLDINEAHLDENLHLSSSGKFFFFLFFLIAGVEIEHVTWS